MKYRTSPADLEGMPPGVPHIIGNEAAERFSFYGMKAVLAVYMAQYLHLMDGTPGTPMSEASATAKVHLFNTAVYFTPLLGALLSDLFVGKYRTIIWLSVVYCMGHGALALMGTTGSASVWLILGLALISLGSGGIKPCVSAHVGDQFGARNSHLLPRVFNWFYFSINIGAAVSMALTPWLLEWYGPHWAFGVPGVLMAIATVVFWMGRKRFIHVPAGGRRVITELFEGGGLVTLLKILPLYLFVAVFWALFDQTGSTWIFQAMDMDREFLGIEWLPSQVQSLNSIFVLTFIPLFTFVLYPAIGRVWKLTALRKIGLGLFIMVGSFSLVALIQQWIDAGQRPSISWQIISYALLTAAEVMVSIVALEFAYTQAPKTMKSLVMCFYLAAVAVGNLLVAGINHFIQIPNAPLEQAETAIEALPDDWQDSPRNVVLPGHDGKTGTDDDFIARYEEGRLTRIEIPSLEPFAAVATRLRQDAIETGRPPTPDEFGDPGKDPWGNPVRYEILNSTRLRLISDGPDRTPGTRWDTGILIDLPKPEKKEKADSWTDRFHPETPWLDQRKAELGFSDEAKEDDRFPHLTFFSGGMTRMEGASYFRFFAYLMFGTAIAFIPFALLYKPKTQLQD
ncbi:POT family MFS transporter [Haloferula sp. A504]|uniref:POT family MFS transporter n=1 Tax=Haloferula sp. A504 TaxID=3373601 RepID=UPI0031C3BE09|nr:POT family MFS transporter [Verrucomicrobiaceae bacterium E54]